MIKTEFFDDFLNYYDKAHIIQQASLQSNNHEVCVNDPLMNNVDIYDVVNRRYAGFSKILEDIYGKRKTGLVKHPSYVGKLDDFEFHLLHLVHRFTGSGASFQPTLLPDGTRNPKEHGYNNSCVGVLAEIMTLSNVKTALTYIAKCEKPMVTSVGNQPPSLKNKQPEKYRLAMQYYFDNWSVLFIKDYLSFLYTSKKELGVAIGIKDTVDFCVKWHKDRGFKQWKFVMTAFVMDTAEYYPHLVEPTSHCYYGSNCIRAFKLMFVKEPTDPKKSAEFYEKCMSELVKARPQSLPYDMEDVCCDAIRYWVEYVPKGYAHLSNEQLKNNSILKNNSEYLESAQIRINEILK